MQLYRDGGLDARIAFNAMSGYDINRVIPRRRTPSASSETTCSSTSARAKT